MQGLESVPRQDAIFTLKENAAISATKQTTAILAPVAACTAHVPERVPEALAAHGLV